MQRNKQISAHPVGISRPFPQLDKTIVGTGHHDFDPQLLPQRFCQVLRQRQDDIFFQHLVRTDGPGVTATVSGINHNQLNAPPLTLLRNMQYRLPVGNLMENIGDRTIGTPRLRRNDRLSGSGKLFRSAHQINNHPVRVLQKDQFVLSFMIQIEDHPGPLLVKPAGTNTLYQSVQNRYFRLKVRRRFSIQQVKIEARFFTSQQMRFCHHRGAQIKYHPGVIGAAPITYLFQPRQVCCFHMGGFFYRGLDSNRFRQLVQTPFSILDHIALRHLINQPAIVTIGSIPVIQTLLGNLSGSKEGIIGQPAAGITIDHFQILIDCFTSVLPSSRHTGKAVPNPGF